MSVAAYAADPSGTYTFAGGGRGGGGGGGGGGGATPPQNTLVLALKDGTLTGKLTSPGRGGAEATTVDITAATFKDDTVAFEVVREFNGNKMTSKYTGKVTADAITGTVLAPGRGGAEPTPRDWVAKKAATK
jgi:hypothetical protein